MNNFNPVANGDVSGNFTSAGFNLIGVEEGSTGFTASTDLKGTVPAPLDPKLDPTDTSVNILGFPVAIPGQPLCGSPVIDKGMSSGQTTDLRGAGYARTIDDPGQANAGDGTDIGVLERQTACINSVLTINIPEPKPGETGMLPKMPGSSGSPQDNALAMSMLLPMLRGLYVDVSLVVDGKIIKTNAPYVAGSQVTLVQFDFDKVTAADGALQKLQQITDPRMLKDIPGVRMPTGPVLTIEFGR